MPARSVLGLLIALLLGVPGAVAAGGWRLMVPPLESVRQVSSRPFVTDEDYAQIVEQAPLSEWTAARTFSTVEACETAARERAAGMSNAGRDHAARIEEARKRGDQRMLDVLEALAPYRARDAAALCVTTN